MHANTYRNKNNESIHVIMSPTFYCKQTKRKDRIRKRNKSEKHDIHIYNEGFGYNKKNK